MSSCAVLDATLLVQVNDGYVDFFCNWLWPRASARSSSSARRRAAGARNSVWVLAYGNETAAAVRGVSEGDGRVRVLTTRAVPGTHGSTASTSTRSPPTRLRSYAEASPRQTEQSSSRTSTPHGCATLSLPRLPREEEEAVAATVRRRRCLGRCSVALSKSLLKE